MIGIYVIAMIGLLILRFYMDWLKEAEVSIKRLSTLSRRSTKHNSDGDGDSDVEDGSK